MSDEEYLIRMRRVADGGKWSTPEEDAAKPSGRMTTMSMGAAGAAMEADSAARNYARLLAIIDRRMPKEFDRQGLHDSSVLKLKGRTKLALGDDVEGALRLAESGVVHLRRVHDGRADSYEPKEAACLLNEAAEVIFGLSTEKCLCTHANRDLEKCPVHGRG